MDSDTISASLGSIRSGLQADGFDLYLRDITAAGAVVVCLEAKPAACLDCLVPDQVLHQIVEAAVKRADPSVQDVVLVKEGFDGVGEHR